MLCLLIAGCAERAPVSRFAEPELVAMQEDVTPPEAKPGICHSRDNTPAQIETVTEQIQVAPPELAEDGRVLTPAIYNTVTSQRIIQDRTRVWFETPCPQTLTPDFIIALQRALGVRGFYPGAPTGLLDEPTQRAIRKFQAGLGLNSNVLSTAAAKRLGLIVYDRDEALATI